MTASRQSSARQGSATYVNASQDSMPRNLSRQDSPVTETTASLRPSDDAGELKREAARRTLFQKISNNQFDIPNGYRKVEVLILRWDESIDEFRKGHNEEVARLKGVFSDLGYGVTVASIQNDRNPQVAFNFEILQHVHRHDGEDTLLIVYYTGHGSQIENGHVRSLQLSATEDSKGRGDIAPVAFWGQAEEPLRNLATADVLSILDCCCASTAAVKGRSLELRAYQLLAASTFEGNTNAPGEKSFTTAFCDSLQELIRESKGESFSVLRLWEMINKKRMSDTALIWNRLERWTRNIDLYHLNSSAQRDALFQRQNPERSSLALRLSLMENDLNDVQIDKLARTLHAACKTSGIPVRQMEWVKMEQSHPIKSFRKLVKRVRRDMRRKTAPGTPQEERQGHQEQPSLYQPEAHSGSNTIPSKIRNKVESVPIPDHEFFTISRGNIFCVLRA